MHALTLTNTVTRPHICQLSCAMPCLASRFAAPEQLGEIADELHLKPGHKAKLVKMLPQYVAGLAALHAK